MADIFAKQVELVPSTMATVADRRFDDAVALCETGDNARAAGAMYLAGFVLEILLKANLVRMYAAIAKKRPHALVDGSERAVWSLIWRSHQLDEMLAAMPTLAAAVEKSGQRAGERYLDWLKGICGVWSIHARYSSRGTTIAEAQRMLDRVRKLKEILK
jgi:hypothetical protein